MRRRIGLILVSSLWLATLGSDPSRGQGKGQSVGGLPNPGPNTGTIVGQVIYKGPPRKPRLISMTADPKCAQLHGNRPVTSDEFVVGPNNGLQWVFVYVKQKPPGSYSPPSTPVVLDQKGCHYTPHVFGIMVGQPLEVLNSDPLLHNIHALPKKNRPFNLAQPVKGMKSQQRFTVPEVMVPIKCDVHPWMASYCGVLDHPFFAVSDGQGKFTLKGLPPGTYTLEAWHERLGTLTQTVKVEAGKTATVTFTYQR